MPELAIAVSWHCPNSAFGSDYAGRYRLGRKIGSGSFGDIYLGARLHLAVTFPLAGPPKRAKTFAHTAILQSELNKEVSHRGQYIRRAFIVTRLRWPMKPTTLQSSHA